MGKTQIQIEEEESKKYDIDFDDNGFPELTLSNVAKIEAMIRLDSKYRKASSKDSKPIERNGNIIYEGSAMYWIDVFKNSNDFNENVIKHIVSCVDRENSTHLNADKTGIDELTNRIIKLGRKQLITYLKDPGSDYDLITILSLPTSPDISEKNKRGLSKYHSRSNFSFATKFCHYMAMELFKNKPEADNFSIYDSVLDKAIKKYFPKYKKFNFFGDYYLYQSVIDEIRGLGKEKISRTGFDHLIWYALKG